VAIDRTIIVREAFATLNEAGLEGLTLRRLASRLGVKAPALYWHFQSKQALLDEMATQVLRESVERSADLAVLPAWREWAAAYYTRLRQILLQYRDGARMLSGTYLTDAELYAPMEINLRRMVDAGFTMRQAIVGLGALYCFTVGFVIEEQATEFAIGQANPQYDLDVREKRVNPELHPLAAAAGAELFQRQDARFTEGIALIIAGMSDSLSSGPTVHRPTAPNAPIPERPRRIDESKRSRRK
jgi:TetR/AcrR family transcriptional regulator, tetracycline repressor protein